MKTLVVYYSRSGNTKVIADEVAEALGADVEELKDTKNRQGAVGYMKSGRDAMKKTIAKLEPTTHNPADYDIVILGGAIWASTICSPTRTYAAEHKGSFKRVAFFCTSGSSDPAWATKGFDALEEVTGMKPVATLGVGQKEVMIDHEQPVADFVASLTQR
ncbi:MAG: hypothetical protein JW846_11185 [Dehalococcoidia bacterium]|nr:hypothetical protein [Dehalococcoidia bacterium]